ncbi:hypothetical protein ACI797_12100 [Geodermatophilus sp. SYSU D00691]
MANSRKWRRWGGAAGLLAAGAVAGGVLAGTTSASAADEGGSGSSTTATDDCPQRPQEELLTGDTEEQVEAAVLAEYPDAEIVRSETDSGGVYESHIVTADGERLTVLVGEDFTVTGTETGGPGGPGGGRGGPGDDED